MPFLAMIFFTMAFLMLVFIRYDVVSDAVFHVAIFIMVFSENIFIYLGVWRNSRSA